VSEFEPAPHGKVYVTAGGGKGWSQAALRELIADAVFTSAQAEPENRTVFVGYPYDLPRDDYRGVFAEVAEEYGVEFLFADEKFTKKHVLEKITAMMRGAALSLFDITLWNPNVALELGIAYAHDLDFYILFDPTKGQTDALTDVRGIDRIQYRSFAELKEALRRLMRGQFGPPPSKEEELPEAGTVMAQLEALKKQIPAILADDPGQPIGGIASSLGVPIDIAQSLIRPMVGSTVETRGFRRGTKYYVAGEAPPEEDVSAEAEDEELETDE